MEKKHRRLEMPRVAFFYEKSDGTYEPYFNGANYTREEVKKMVEALRENHNGERI